MIDTLEVLRVEITDTLIIIVAKAVQEQCVLFLSEVSMPSTCFLSASWRQLGAPGVGA